MSITVMGGSVDIIEYLVGKIYFTIGQDIIIVKKAFKAEEFFSLNWAGNCEIVDYTLSCTSEKAFTIQHNIQLLPIVHHEAFRYRSIHY